MAETTTGEQIRIWDSRRLGNWHWGKATNVVDFGAFVDLGEGVEGLIHGSEMPGRDVVRAQLEPGSSITVRVLEIDHERHRIGLSLRDVASRVPFEHLWVSEKRSGR